MDPRRHSDSCVAAEAATDRVWVVLLYRSGEFAGAIFRIFGGDFKCIAHKAFHKYTVRR